MVEGLERIERMRFIHKMHVFVAYAVGILFALLMLTKLIPLGVSGHWVYPYRDLDKLLLSFRMIALGMIAGLVIIVVARLQERIGAKLVLVFLSVSMLHVNVMIHKPLVLSLAHRILAITYREINPYFSRGLEITSPWKYPEEHLELMKRGYRNLPTYYRRLSTYPPGFPLIYFSINRLTEATKPLSTNLGNLALNELLEEEQEILLSMLDHKNAIHTAVLAIILHLLAAALIPLSVYLVTAVLSEQRQALQAAAASCLVPSFHLFASSPDILLTILATFTAYFFIYGYSKNKTILSFFSGVLVSLGLFLSFNFIPVALFCALFLFLADLGAPFCWKVRKFIYFLCGILAGLAVFVLIGYNVLETFVTAMRNNKEFYEISGRSWSISVVANIVELSIFGGLIWALAYCFCFLVISCRLITKRTWPVVGKLDLPSAFCVALGITFIALLYSGSARGEVARNCMHLVPFFISATFSQKVFSREQFVHFNCASLIILLFMTSLVEVSFVL